MSGVPEREAVAVRWDSEDAHRHIIAVKFADGGTIDAAELITAIGEHRAHYFMRIPEGKLLLRVQQCPDCLETVVWA